MINNAQTTWANFWQAFKNSSSSQFCKAQICAYNYVIHLNYHIHELDVLFPISSKRESQVSSHVYYLQKKSWLKKIHAFLIDHPVNNMISLNCLDMSTWYNFQDLIVKRHFIWLLILWLQQGNGNALIITHILY
jgi:hypothetical protein